MDGNKPVNRKLSLDSLGYSLDCGGYLQKSKECKLRRRSDGMKYHLSYEHHLDLLNKNFQRSGSIRTTSTIEEEGSDFTDGFSHHNSFKNKSRTFFKHFPEIPETELLIGAFYCALQKDLLYHGRMYVSQQHVCFYSSVLLKETKVMINISTIQSIKKSNIARVVPNAISIVTSAGDKYLFGSLRNRDACFGVLRSVCPQLQYESGNGSPQMSSPENDLEPDIDIISSHSSQEDSPESHGFSVSGHNRMTASNVSLLSSVSDTQVEEKTTPSTSTSRDSQSSEENTDNTLNTPVSWVTMVTERMRSLLFLGGTTSVNKLITVYLILALLLLLSSGYIGLRIAALEKQLNTLGATSEFNHQKSYQET